MFPEAFQARMTSLLGEEAEAFFDALAGEPCRALRLDPEKTSEEELRLLFADGLGEKIPFCEHAYRFSVDGIGNSPLHHGGALYVQEPAAMAPVAALPREKVRRILDLCAAPGGKSLQAASLLLEEDGVIVSNEPVSARRRVLMQNIERMGEKRSLVTGFDGEDLPAAFEGRFDLVICDVPCSGEGMMRKNSEAASLWSRENILVCAARQKEILESAARACASGGRVLYSTCTWAVEENEEQVLSFLIRHPEFSLAEPAPAVSAVASCGITPKDSPVSLSRTLRFYPHRFPGEGQFLAIFEKTGEAEERRGPKKEKKKAKEKPSPYEKTVRDFLREVLSEEPREKILFRGEEAYLCPDTAIPPERFVSPGTLLGTVQKGRVIPHHRFFLAYADTFRRKVMLDPFDPRVEAYLAGEELALSGERGFAVLFAGRCPLGGVKISDGRGKNFYPKGLRKAKKDV